MVVCEDPGLTSFHRHTEFIHIYRTIPPEGKLGPDWIASAQ